MFQHLFDTYARLDAIEILYVQYSTVATT
jgi:hypothetical protein